MEEVKGSDGEVEGGCQPAGGRKMAYIVRIDAVGPIPKAERVMKAQTGGWDVVVKLNEFAAGDLAIYFEIGSVPSIAYEATAFLKGQVIRTKKMFGVCSQGLLGPISWLPPSMRDVDVGTDCTEVLGVMKWVDSSEMGQYKADDETRAPWPGVVPKTDEERIQNIRNLPELFPPNVEDVVITQKYDGCSASFMLIKGQPVICGRNYQFLTATKSTVHYFDAAKKYDIERKLQEYGKELALQGEIIGPKQNGNRHRVKEVDFFLFNVYDIQNRCYMDHDKVVELATIFGLKTVPCIYRGLMKPEWDVKSLLALADKQVYESGAKAEGLVLKTASGNAPRYSCKIISNSFLLKYNL